MSYMVPSRICSRATWSGILRPALVAFLAVGCEDSPTTPVRPPPASANGTIVVVAAATGNDVDPDGFDVRVNNGPPRRVASGSAVVFADMPPGPHSVSIEDVAPNCVLRDDSPRTVTVVPREHTAIVFSLHCQNRLTSGALRVVIATPGFGTFGVALDMAPPVNASNGKVLFTDLLPGTYLLRLDVKAGDCTVDGLNPRSASVAAGRITDVAFTLSCPNPGRSIVVGVSTTGNNQPRSYSVRIQESSDHYCYYYTCQFKTVDANGAVRFDDLSTVNHYVQLESIPLNCTAQPTYHDGVAVLADRGAQVTFAVHCT